MGTNSGNIEHFDGETFDPVIDGKRLTSQLERVRALMSDGKWRTLAEIHAVVGGSEAGVSARLRDLRKQRFGGHNVVRQRWLGQPWQYGLGLRQADLPFPAPEHFEVSPNA